jgi:glutathione S-transferase
MIDLYYWTTPNGHKITIFLEEVALAYTIKPVNISKGEHARQGIELEEFPHLRRGFNAMGARPAVQRAYAKAAEMNTGPTVTEAAKAILFGQGRRLAA